MALIPIINDVAFGNTNPVANCAKAFASEMEMSEAEAVGMAFHLADAYIHGVRKTASEKEAFDRFAKADIHARRDFSIHLQAITRRVGVH